MGGGGRLEGHILNFLMLRKQVLETKFNNVSFEVCTGFLQKTNCGLLLRYGLKDMTNPPCLLLDMAYIFP
jgi:hypothetical protein